MAKKRLYLVSIPIYMEAETPRDAYQNLVETLETAGLDVETKYVDINNQVEVV